MDPIYLTWKQLDKYVLLCDKYETPAQLGNMNYVLVSELSDNAEPFPRWYGRNNAAEEYVIIMPSGEHYYHDDYLLFNISQWIRGLYPKRRSSRDTTKEKI